FERRVGELQVHPAADEARLDHRAAPRGPVDGDQGRLRTKHRMPPDQRLSQALVLNRICAILGLDLEYRAGGHIAQVHTTFDLRTYDVPIDDVGKMRACPKHHLQLKPNSHVSETLSPVNLVPGCPDPDRHIIAFTMRVLCVWAVA